MNDLYIKRKEKSCLRAYNKVFLSTITLFFAIMPLVSANIILMWNGTQGGIPSGWTCQSCDTGYFYELSISGTEGLYPKIANSFCGSDGEIACGGSDSHSHTYSVASSVPSATTNMNPGVANGVNTAGSGHLHTSLNQSSSKSSSSLPLSYVLLYIMAVDGNEDTIPAGAITMFNGTSTPTGFNLYTSADGYYLVSGTNGTQNSIIGSISHNHSNHTLRTGTPSSNGVATAGTKATSSTTHTHQLTTSIGWNNSYTNHTPAYINMPLIYATADTTIPVGAIVMTNNTENWSLEWTKQNYSDWLGKLIVANSTSFNTTGGLWTHSLGTISSGTLAGAGVNRALGGSPFASSGHTHTINVTATDTQNNPAYSNVTIFRLDQELTTTLTDCWEINGKSLKAGFQCLFYKIGGLFGL